MYLDTFLETLESSIDCFDISFCNETIEFLKREVDRLQQEKDKALNVLKAAETGCSNPIRVIIANDIENFISKLDVKIFCGEESIYELNARRVSFELRMKNVVNQENLEADEELYLVDEGIADMRSISSTTSECLDSLGYSSGKYTLSPVDLTDELKHFRHKAVAYLGGELSYFAIDESVLPKSLYGS